MKLERGAGFQSLVHVQATLITVHCNFIVYKTTEVCNDSCGLFTFDNFTVSQENLQYLEEINVKFLIRVPFMCTNSMHKVLTVSFLYQQVKFQKSQIFHFLKAIVK